MPRCHRRYRYCSTQHSSSTPCCLFFFLIETSFFRHDKAAAEIFYAIHKNRTLKKLNFAGNKAGPEVSDALAGMVSLAISTPFPIPFFFLIIPFEFQAVCSHVGSAALTGLSLVYFPCKRRAHSLQVICFPQKNAAGGFDGGLGRRVERRTMGCGLRLWDKATIFIENVKNVW